MMMKQGATYYFHDVGQLARALGGGDVTFFALGDYPDNPRPICYGGEYWHTLDEARQMKDELEDLITQIEKAVG